MHDQRKLERYEVKRISFILCAGQRKAGHHTRCIYMHTNLLVFVCDVPHPPPF